MVNQVVLHQVEYARQALEQYCTAQHEDVAAVKLDKALQDPSLSRFQLDPSVLLEAQIMLLEQRPDEALRAFVEGAVTLRLDPQSRGVDQIKARLPNNGLGSLRTFMAPDTVSFKPPELTSALVGSLSKDLDALHLAAPSPLLLKGEIARAFGGDVAAVKELEKHYGDEQIRQLHTTFGGAKSLPALGDVIRDVCHGDIARFVALEKALGGFEGVRAAYAVFNGDTDAMALMLARHGSPEGFAAALTKAKFHVAILQLDTEGPQRKLAAENAATRLHELGVTDPAVSECFRDFAHLEIEVAALQSSGLRSPAAYGAFIGEINAALKTAGDLLGKLVKKRKPPAAEVNALKTLIAEGTKARDGLGETFETLSRPMRFSDQRMVPSASDLVVVRERMAQDKTLTQSQAWALEGTRIKGAHEQAKYRLLGLQRLGQLNKSWGTNYSLDDYERCMLHMQRMNVCSNYTLNQAPGANLNRTGKKDKSPTLLKLLIGTPDLSFKNVWQTRKSQAAVSDPARGAVEEQFGYAKVLNRQSGRYQDIDDPKSKFKITQPEVLPKYAALVSASQKEGVSPRYGPSFIVWKDSVRAHATHTPGDSWNRDRQGAAFVTDPTHPEVVFANSDDHIVRLAMAEATGKDEAWLKKARADGAPLYGYIETQLHGEVTWSDVDTVVVGDKGEDNPEEVVAELEKFARDNKLDFRVVRKSEMGTPQTEPIPLSAIGSGGSNTPLSSTPVTSSGGQGVLGRRASPLVAAPGTVAYTGFIQDVDRRYVRQQNDGQGDCLFHAFSQGMQRLNRPTTAVQARQGAVQGMTAQHQADANFFAGINTANYFQRMGLAGQWGGEYEIAGLARQFGVHVRMHQPDGNGGVVTTDYGRVPPAQNAPAQGVVDIVWVNRNHYELLVPRPAAQ